MRGSGRGFVYRGIGRGDMNRHALQNNTSFLGSVETLHTPSR
jgi:hypothetical protein